MRKWRLQTQLLVYLLCCITIVFSILFLVIRSQVSGLQTDRMEGINLELVESKAREMGAWLNQRLCEIRVVASHESFKSHELSEMLPYLEVLNSNISETYGDVSRPFVISDDKGTVFLSNGETLDISQREFFQQAFASKKEYTISKPLYSRLEDRRVVIISYAIYTEGKNRMGYIHGTLSLDIIDGVLSSSTMYDGVVYIMDNAGRILAESENHKHGEMQAKCPKSYQFAQIERIFGDDESGINSLPLIDGAEGMIFYADIPYTPNWSLCVLVPRSVLDAPIRTTDSIILLIGVVLALAACLLSVFYARSVMKPVNELVNAMDAYEPKTDPPQYSKVRSQELAKLWGSFNRMTERISTLRSKIVEEQELKREAERRLLQAQMNPHFLYNTLDTISWKALEQGAEDVSDLICALAQFFRLSLSNGQELVTLEQEMEHVYSYLYIQKVRYEDKLSFELQLNDCLKGCMVPKLLIQPLVENAIYHGIKPKAGASRLVVRIIPHGKHSFEIMVADNGAGMTPERLKNVRKNLNSGESNAGYGLCAMQRRLFLTYRTNCSVQVKSVFGKGTVVRMILPRKGDEVDI